MQLENQVCSLELAKKLKELGVKQESLFYWVGEYEGSGHPSSPYGFTGKYYLKTWDKEKDNPPIDYNYCSAFTVAELGEMLPMDVHNGKHNYFFETERYSHKRMWEVVYRDENKSNLVLAMQVADTEADCRAKMLIYLLENKLITPPLEE